MLKTIIVLPDGTELSSGIGTVNAIQSVTLKECVNGAQELTLGSVCANSVDVKVITPAGGLSVAAGDEITVYKLDEEGTRRCIGLFTIEKPTRPSANTMKITGYDRVTWLDKDLTQWLAALSSWPYSLHDFAGMVCSACGLSLANDSIPNGGYQIRKFSADGITGRQLLQWVGEICGRFCRATPEGKIEFAWYTPVTDVSIKTVPLPDRVITYASGTLSIDDGDILAAIRDGTLSAESVFMENSHDGGVVTVTLNSKPVQLYYFQNGLSFEDYEVQPIQKVQIRQNEEDVGTVYPAVDGEVNTYIITGNMLLTAETAEELAAIARTLYEQLKDVSYTPCKVSIPAGLEIRAGNTVQITDRNGRTFTAYVMTKTQTGQKDTLECTGSARRASTTAVNSKSYKALAGKVLNIKADVEGMRVENADMKGNLTRIEADLSGLSSTVQQTEKTADGLRQEVTALKQSADQVAVTVQDIVDNGVSKVSNEFGLTIDQSAVTIHRSGSEMVNKLDEKGMSVVRGSTVMLQANASGVIATDVSVRNYLIIGEHARFEDYSDGSDSARTACFFI